ncbi:MAG: long-chain-fatty-acid--CoA ligase [Hyphomicrobiaceae bacterium]
MKKPPESTTSLKKSGAHPPSDNYPWLNRYPEDVAWDQKFSPRPLPDLLSDAVNRFGTLACTNFLGKTLTYSEIGQLVDQTVAGLQKLGIKKGTRVGLFLPNCPTFVVYYYAILKAGGTVVNFNPLYTVEELAKQSSDSGTEIMVTLDLKQLFEKVEALVEKGSLKKVIVASFPALLPPAKSVLFRLFKSGDLAQLKSSPIAPSVIVDRDVISSSATATPVAIDPEKDIAVLQYTGGTTGTPKGAMLSHANLYINVMQVNSWTPELRDGEERVLGALPFFHVFAMTVVMNFAIAKGSEMIIMPRFVLDDALKLIQATKPTVMPGVPTLFNAIYNHPKIKKFDLSSLRFCLSGGAALPIEVKSNFETLLPTGKVVEGYGLSETSPVVTCNPVNGPIRKGSIGMPLPATIISLRDLADPTKEVPIGEKGEICIKGPQVMSGYWNNPSETKDAFVGDFFRTGDVARVDDDGMFYIEDRIKDLIISNGYNVYPRRIEDAIYAHSAVEEVTVIGIPNDERGEAPKAFIKLKKGYSATTEDIFSHLAEKISKIEMPAEIEFRETLPKTMIGKLSKKELKDELS